MHGKKGMLHAACCLARAPYSVLRAVLLPTARGRRTIDAVKEMLRRQDDSRTSAWACLVCTVMVSSVYMYMLCITVAPL